MADWRTQVQGYLPDALRTWCASLSQEEAGRATELRIRAGQRVLLRMGQEELCAPLGAAPQDIARIAEAMLGHARYARQEELRQGYITLPGGCRAGLCGRVVVEDGRVHHLQEVGSIVLRIARALPGAADALMNTLWDGRAAQSTLLVAAPGQGKTTLLRDAARQLSLAGQQVCIVDERSELAGCVQGVPQLDVGPRTDVLDACPKAEGMMMALRALSPQVLVADEIGREEDARAVLEALRCGVALLTSAHGRSVEEVRARPVMRMLLSAKAFARVVLLAQEGAPGRIAGIWPLDGDRH